MSGDKIKRVRAVRQWLEKAEHSYSSHKEITGEINLIMAQAEMQRLKETSQNSRFQKYALRAGAMFAAFVIFLGINLIWNVVLNPENEVNHPVQIVINENAPVTVSEVSPADSAAVYKENTADNTAVEIHKPFPETYSSTEDNTMSVESSSVTKPRVTLSDKEIQSVVGEAGRALRGQV